MLVNKDNKRIVSEKYNILLHEKLANVISNLRRLENAVVKI